MKKSFCTLLLCSSFVFSDAQAVVPLLFKGVALNSLRLLSATSAAGASVITVAFLGTVEALGEAQHKITSEGDPNRTITVPDIADAWVEKLQRLVDGYFVCESAGAAAWERYNKRKENRPRDQHEPRPTQHPLSAGDLQPQDGGILSGDGDDSTIVPGT
jgi:hypothetical protein